MPYVAYSDSKIKYVHRICIVCSVIYILCVYVCVCGVFVVLGVYVCMCVCVYIYIYIYIYPRKYAKRIVSQ